MLQIVQGMYFRPVPLTDTLHRGIFYTNLRAFREQTLTFVFGRLLPSTTFDGPRTFTVEAREQLEAQSPSGTLEVLAATSGDQLLDEVAAVVAFCTNATCVRDHDMARRLISAQQGEERNRRGPASLLRQTFDATVILTDEGVADLERFTRSLLGLQRKSYEAVIRAIRQIVDATLIVDEDAALAYTLMVAALESLGQASESEPAVWEDYDPSKRHRIDAATQGLDDVVRARIESAVLANEHHGLQRQFVAFVLDHVEPSFYRNEAVGAIRPIKTTELPNALRQAYSIRSRTVHALGRLAREVWMAGDRADTALLDTGIVLSLEGLSRLSRHVVRRFVERAPQGVDSTFNYRSALPGIMPGRWAAQYWIGRAGGFNRDTAAEYFDGMLTYLIEGLSKRSETGLVDMSPVLESIEGTALGLSKREDRLAMAGIMTVWNTVAPPDRRRRLKPKLAKRFEADLAEPSMVSFAIGMVLGRPIEWSTEDMQLLSDARWKERLGNKPAPLPMRVDAALHILLADRLLHEGSKTKALGELGRAVETVPGLAPLIEFEQAIERGEDPVLNLSRFVLGEAEFIGAASTASDRPQSDEGQSGEVRSD